MEQIEASGGRPGRWARTAAWMPKSSTTVKNAELLLRGSSDRISVRNDCLWLNGEVVNVESLGVLRRPVLTEVGEERRP